MLLKFLLLIVVWCYQEVDGYGYRYNYNPGTGESNLWTYLPGHEQPVVYAYTPGQPWPQVYSVAYDGLLPNQPVLPSGGSYNNAPDDPNLYRYKGPDGKFRYKCKPDAFYSEYQRKCQWKPGYYGKNRGGSQ